jgi:DNA-directed RNA polymerase specialized sigma subunit
MNHHDIKTKLKEMSKPELRALFEKAELEETEKWLLKYAYIDERLVLNTCAKLNISESTYYRMLPIALVKIYYTLKFN